MIGSEKIAVVRGGGDLATEIIYRLWRIGFRVLCLEIQKSLVVRRTVSAASAIFNGSITVKALAIAGGVLEAVCREIS